MRAAGPIGMVIALVSVALAASNLLLDFDMIENSSYRGMPKWMEWYSGFSLLVTVRAHAPPTACYVV